MAIWEMGTHMCKSMFFFFIIYLIIVYLIIIYLFIIYLFIKKTSHVTYENTPHFEMHYPCFFEFHNIVLLPIINIITEIDFKVKY